MAVKRKFFVRFSCDLWYFDSCQKLTEQLIHKHSEKAKRKHDVVLEQSLKYWFSVRCAYFESFVRARPLHRCIQPCVQFGQEAVKYPFCNVSYWLGHKARVDHRPRHEWQRINIYIKEHYYTNRSRHIISSIRLLFGVLDEDLYSASHGCATWEIKYLEYCRRNIMMKEGIIKKKNCIHRFWTTWLNRGSNLLYEKNNYPVSVALYHFSKFAKDLLLSLIRQAGGNGVLWTLRHCPLASSYQSRDFVIRMILCGIA